MSSRRAGIIVVGVVPIIIGITITEIAIATSIGAVITTKMI